MLRALALLLMFAVACDEPTRDAEGDPLTEALAQAQPIALEAFCGRYLGAVCRRHVECGRFADVPNPYEPCEEWILAMQPACEAHWLALPAAGMATYSAEDAGRCLTLLRVGLCGDVFDDPAFIHRCVRDAFTGAGAGGDACHSDLGCQPGFVCDLSAACPGACVAAPERPPVGLFEGSGCGGEKGECGFGLTCFEGACVRPRNVGEACGDRTGVCDEFAAWCKPAEGADPEAPLSGVCASLPEAGQECGPGLGERCSGAACDPGFGFCFNPPRAGGATCDPRFPEVCDSWVCDAFDDGSGQGECAPVGWPFPDCPVPVEESPE